LAESLRKGSRRCGSRGSRRSRSRTRCGRSTPAFRSRSFCRKLGISEPTYYAWKKKYAGMDVAEMRRVKQLEEPTDVPPENWTELSLRFSLR
jgi:hypothetical protein